MIDGPQEARKREFPVAPVITLAILTVVALAVFYRISHASKEVPKDPVPTPEARLYVHNGLLALSEVEMKASESFAQQTLVEITGKIGNKGDRSAKLIDIYCIFKDPYGAVVLRERLPIVGSRTGSLKPGETKAFRLPFDAIPQTWNQTLPELVIAQIVFD